MNNKLNGIINFNKPAGITSHDAVYLIRKFTGIKRVGHTGTLDPMATGVLPICIGKATRIIEYLDYDNSNKAKAYSCELTLGVSSETNDIWGKELVKDSFDNVTKVQIKDAFSNFIGDILQIPPMYSAIKIDGKKLYEYARNGEKLDEGKVKARKISIRSIDITSMDLDKGKVKFNVECSQGTYIRSICRDVGEILGCGAALSALERTRSNGFEIGNAYTEMDLIALNDLSQIVFPMDQAISTIPFLILEDDQHRIDFISGRAVGLEKSSNRKAGLYRVYDNENIFLGMGMLKDDGLFPKKVIVEK
jgi:tRNA pseudouridine55 synthase